VFPGSYRALPIQGTAPAELEAFKLDAELPRSASQGQAAKDEGPLPVVQLKN